MEDATQEKQELTDPETGEITPESLYIHFDMNGDGKVDFLDYCAHILYHFEHPELLLPYMKKAEIRLKEAGLEKEVDEFSAEEGHVDSTSTEKS